APVASLAREARPARDDRRSGRAAALSRGVRPHRGGRVRLLIVLPGALGDVIRGLPLLGRLRRRHPDATIGWLVQPLSAPILAGHPWLDRVHRFERSRGVAGYVAVAREVRAAGYDVALDLGRSAKTAWLCALSRAPRRIGFAREDAREGAWLLAT